jgi:hypothetical protein
MILHPRNTTAILPSSSLTECIESMDCPPVLKTCWGKCFPCKTRAECERLVSIGEVAEEGVGNCNSAAARAGSRYLLGLALLLAFIWS